MKNVFALLFVVVLMFNSAVSAQSDSTKTGKPCLCLKKATHKVATRQEARLTVGEFERFAGVVLRIQDSKKCCPDNTPKLPAKKVVEERFALPWWAIALLTLLSVVVGALIVLASIGRRANEVEGRQGDVHIHNYLPNGTASTETTPKRTNRPAEGGGAH